MDDIEQFGRENLIKVAHWYYQNGLTQEQIAQRLNCTRQRVNRMMKSLTELGIVTIQITASVSDYLPLEDRLEQKFSLHRVLIVDCPQAADQTAALELARRGAKLVESLINNRQSVGIAFGSVLGQLVACMRTQVKSLCRAVQLVGGIDADQMGKSIRPDLTARLLAKKLGCSTELLVAPGILGKPREQVLAHPEILRVMRNIEECDVALVEVERLGEGCAAQKLGYISAEEACKYEQAGGVGELAFNRFGPEGEELGTMASERFVGVEISTLRRIPHVVAVASGADRAASVLGALKTGCVNELIVDSALALELERML